MPSSALLIGFAAVFLRAPSPNTGDASIVLDWQAPATCPARADVDALLKVALRSSPSHAATHATAHVEKTERGFVLTLDSRVGGRNEQRVLEDRDCANLARAAALLVAMHARVHAPEPEPEETPSDAAETSIVPSIARQAAPPPAPVTTTGERVRWGLSIGTTLEVAGLPKAAPQFDIYGIFEKSVFQTRVGIGYFANGRDVVLHRWTAGLQLCALSRSLPIFFSVCLGGESGLLVARGLPGKSIDDPERVVSFWADAVFGGGLGWRIRPNWDLSLTASGLAALREIVLTNGRTGEVLFDVRRWGGRFGLSTTVRFPQR